MQSVWQMEAETVSIGLADLVRDLYFMLKEEGFVQKDGLTYQAR